MRSAKRLSTYGAQECSKKNNKCEAREKNRNYEDKMDTELIDTIKGTIYKIWQMKERIAQLKEQRKPIPSYLTN